MISERQEKLLDLLVAEYISTAEPVSSKTLKKKSNLDCCEATIRNDLQVLMEKGFIEQPHISAGRVPTQKAYKYIADKLNKTSEFCDIKEINIARISIVRQMEFTRKIMEKEIKQMEKFMRSLEQGDMFDILNILDQWHKKIMN